MPRAAIVDLLLERAASHPHEPYLLFEERTITWSDLAESALRCAHGLVDRRVQPGDRVAIMLENSPEFLFTYFGALAAGAGTVPVNVALRGAVLRRVLAESGARLAVVERALEQAVREVAPPSLEIVVHGKVSYDHMMSAPDTIPEMGEGETSGLGIIYTSGASGPPKAVVASAYDLSHIHLLLGMIGVAPGETIYACLPLFHGNALTLSAMGAIWNRWTLALAPRFRPERFWSDTRRHGAVEANVLGLMIPLLLKEPERPDDADNPVRTILSCGCPPWAWDAFQTRFGVRTLEFYGLVDHPGYLVNVDGVPGRVGRPIGKTRFRVVDEAGRDVPAGTPGELIMRHPLGRLAHYHRDPAATAAAYRDGWFHTGDAAFVDERGLFAYAGRMRETIHRGGERVFAWDVENVVMEHPGVREAAAHAVASGSDEEDVKVLAVLQPGAQVSEAELADWCAARLPAVAVPSYVELRDELPRTGTHRIRYEPLKAEGVTDATWHRVPVSSRR